MSWVAVAALFGVTGVLAGAFGAHGLADRLAPDKLSAWNTAAHYQLLHAVALLALGLFAQATQRSVQVPALLMALGIVLFSGSIYGLALGGPRLLGPVTPLGGLCFVAGWASLFWSLRG